MMIIYLLLLLLDCRSFRVFCFCCCRVEVWSLIFDFIIDFMNLLFVFFVWRCLVICLNVFGSGRLDRVFFSLLVFFFLGRDFFWFDILLFCRLLKLSVFGFYKYEILFSLMLFNI